MTTSCDSQPVPRHREQPGLEHEFLRGTEYHDIESWSDSDLREISRRKSGFRPSGNVLRVGKSFDDLRKPFKTRNHRLKSIANLRPTLPNFFGPTASDFGDHTDAKPSSSGIGKLCENCLGMSIENLAQIGGYKHSRVSELLKSSEWCPPCILMATSLGIPGWTKFTADRYQLVLSIENPGDDAKVLFDSTQSRQPCPPPRHFSSRPSFLDGFSHLCVEVIDLDSWDTPEEIRENGSDHESLPPFLEPDGSELRSVCSKVLFCLTEEHDPATEFGMKYVRQICSDPSSSHSFNIAAGWLASCLSAETPPKLEDWKPYLYSGRAIEPYSGHEAGGSKLVASNDEVASLTTQSPLRLVEIQSDARGKATSIRVIHTDGRHYTYAALSYCWGKAPPGDDRSWQTTQATLKGHLKGINVRHLPQTLQDAISICEMLHIPYLWVDSLCIIQDSPSDWAAEAAKMSSIYLGSLLTISLSASVSAESGCFNHEAQRIANFEVSHWVTIDTRMRDGRSSRLYVNAYAMRPSTFDEVLRGVLGQRAWALQEHIMPQRTLYITSKQLLWECRHCRLSEDNYPQKQGDLLYPICDYGFPLDATAIIIMWYRRVVEDYTRRQLTYEKDKLVALSALARATYLNRHIGYVAGLWRDCIVPGLLWIRQGLGFKSSTYSCPTWSWASQNSAVAYKFATPSMWTAEPSDFFPRVRDVSWATKPENPFGDVLSAHIDLDTTIALGTVLRDNTFNDRPLWTQYDSQALMITGSGQNRAYCTNAIIDDANRGGRNVVVANMGHCFLLLEPPSLSSEEYRRVGIAIPNVVPFDHEQQFHMDDLTRGWIQRTIRLV